MDNLDTKTVESFGEEWERFDQSSLTDEELHEIFQMYFEVFPWNRLPRSAVGFDLGCGSGRWARFVSQRVHRLYCIDASKKALEVAKRNLANSPNCRFVLASVDGIPLKDSSMDFGYSLGVLHHVPDTEAGIRSCVSKLKTGAPFLLYLYYAFDNRPVWFRWLWHIANFARKAMSELNPTLKYWMCQIISVVLYYPLARLSLVLEKLGVDVSSFPLSWYRRRSLYVMRNDALDRFGTRLEKRFTASEIRRMMAAAGLDDIRLSTNPPYWCAVGVRKQE